MSRFYVVVVLLFTIVTSAAAYLVGNVMGFREGIQNRHRIDCEGAGYVWYAGDCHEVGPKVWR
jgi:hypothetical protein